MIRNFFHALLLSSVVVLCLCSCKKGPATGNEKSFMDWGREYSQMFYDQDFNKLYEKFTPEMKAAMNAQQLSDFYDQVEESLGSEQKIFEEQLDTVTSPYFIYNRIASYSQYSGKVLVRWVMDEQKAIAGFFLYGLPKEAISNYLNYQTKTELHLPFDEEWFVYWGGRTIQQNYHAAYPDQRFAYDFLQMKNKRSHQGDGTKNEDYYCFGKAVISPGTGVIVEIVDTISENIPGQMNSSYPLGNHVIISHGHGEYSFMAHFMKGSIIVNTGDKVVAGQEIGLCGNTGNSSEPHLHYHLQTTPDFSQGEGLPAQFIHYLADDKKINRGEPTRGQRVRNDTIQMNGKHKGK